MPAGVKKCALVTALSSCLENSQKRAARRFLQGLATDELQYIAEFLGACIIETGGRCRGSRAQLAEAIKQFGHGRRTAMTAESHCGGSVQDQEHKMILLLEYLCRSGTAEHSMSVGAGQG